MQKADVSEVTARRACNDLISEELIDVDKGSLPRVYRWIGDFKHESSGND